MSFLDPMKRLRKNPLFLHDKISRQLSRIHKAYARPSAAVVQDYCARYEREESCQTAGPAYFLSLAADPELSTRAMVGSDEFGAGALDGPLSEVAGSPSDVAPARNFCGIMFGV